MTKTQLMMSLYATLIGAALALFALPAQAQQGAQQAACGLRGDMVTKLSSQFGETRRGIGIGKKNRILEVFASEATGTWTITVTLPDGRMCLVASGQAWEDRMDDLAYLADAET